MKKLLSLIAAATMALVLAGCGNSPDGDGQKPTDTPYGTPGPFSPGK